MIVRMLNLALTEKHQTSPDVLAKILEGEPDWELLLLLRWKPSVYLR